MVALRNLYRAAAHTNNNVSSVLRHKRTEELTPPVVACDLRHCQLIEREKPGSSHSGPQVDKGSGLCDDSSVFRKILPVDYGHLCRRQKVVREDIQISALTGGGGNEHSFKPGLG